MQMRPRILVIDDGELSDVLVALGALGASCVRLPWAQYDSSQHFPSRLLISTARYAFMRLQPSLSTLQTLHPIQIVFVDHYSQSAQQRLIECGADFLVRRPISRGRLREILQRALAGNSDRRRALRTTMQNEIRVRDGLLYRSALLADLSLTGCQLVTSLPFKQGATVQVQLASALPQQKSLCVPGRVVRSNRRCKSRFGEITASGVHFDSVNLETQQKLETLLMLQELRTLMPTQSAPGPGHA